MAEIQKHLRHVSSETIFVITTGKDVLDSSLQVIITSYDLMAKCKDKLLARKFGVVIMVSLDDILLITFWNFIINSLLHVKTVHSLGVFL